MTTPRLHLAGTVLATRDPRMLAGFYERLLGVPRLMDEDDWVVLRGDPASHALAFHTDVHYVAPTWPSTATDQQMMAHIDILTDDLEGALAHAVACGATLTEHRSADDERVLLDPDGHPFCLIERASW